MILTDRWSAGAAYEPYIGRWSRRIAREFVAWLGVAAEASWVDVGCGTGALTDTILANASPGYVLALDSSPAFTSYSREHAEDGHATFAIADARGLPVERESADAVVSGLVINFVSQPELALFEMTRVARDGAVVASYVWDYAEGMQMLRVFWDAAVALDPEVVTLDEARRFPLCRPQSLEALWRSTGLQNVECTALETPTRFRDFTDFWQPFLGGQGPAPAYVASLSDEQKSALKARLRDELPSCSDGSIQLTARAWAVRGRRS